MRCVIIKTKKCMYEIHNLCVFSSGQWPQTVTAALLSFNVKVITVDTDAETLQVQDISAGPTLGSVCLGNVVRVTQLNTKYFTPGIRLI